MALTDKLTAIGNAIRTKTGGSALIPLSDMPAEILSIETGGAPLQNPALILMDWEGTKLAEYSRDDALALTELPAPNTLKPYADVDHEYLSFNKWSWSLANVKAWINNNESEVLLVGANYTSSDGSTHTGWDDPRLSDSRMIAYTKKGTGWIGDRQYLNFKALKAVNIAPPITNFGVNAFQGCTNLNYINIPTATTTIRQNAFSGCAYLKYVCLPPELTVIEAYSFQGCNSLESINIPNGVTTIGDYAFSGCTKLKAVKAPSTITSIGNNAFYGCYRIEKLIIPSTITSIGSHAFNGCYNLMEMSIPDSITTISPYMLSACCSLLALDIPLTITTIYQYAFDGCYSLKNVVLRGKPSLSSTTAFGQNPSDQKIYVPRENLTWFETATNWSAIFSKFVAIEDYIEYLEALGFNVDEYKEVA